MKKLLQLLSGIIIGLFISVPVYLTLKQPQYINTNETIDDSENVSENEVMIDDSENVFGNEVITYNNEAYNDNLYEFTFENASWYNSDTYVICEELTIKVDLSDCPPSLNISEFYNEDDWLDAIYEWYYPYICIEPCIVSSETLNMYTDEDKDKFYFYLKKDFNDYCFNSIREIEIKGNLYEISEKEYREWEQGITEQRLSHQRH